MSADIRAGGAYVELMLRDANFLKRLKAAGASLANFAAGAAKLGAVLGGVGFIASIKAASDLEETMNKFNVVFGQNAVAVKKWSDTFAGEVGRSEKQIADFMAGTQDLFVPLGFEPGAATEMSKQITGLAVDLASFNNTADADSLNDLQAALTGSGEVMKKYGVIVSEATVKQEALNQGLDPKNLSEQEKVLMRLNIIMKGTTAAQGDAIRSAGSFANQMKSLRASISNMLATIGSAFLPMVNAILPVLKSFVDAIANYMKAATDAIHQAWTAAWEWMRPVLGAIFQLTTDVFWTIGREIYAAFSYINGIVTSMWSGVLGNTGSAMQVLQFGIIGALSTVSFWVQEWRLVVARAFIGAAYNVVSFANQTGYFLGEVIPAYLDWFARNWQDYFRDVAAITATVANNIWVNLKNLWQAIVRLFQGQEFAFEWTNLTQGFVSAIKELPKVAEREIPLLEKQLKRDIETLAKEVSQKWDVHQRDFVAKAFNWIPGGGAAGGAAAGPGGLPGGAGMKLPEIAGIAGRNVQKEVFATFSASAAVARGQGGGGPAVAAADRTTKAVEQVLKATEHGFGRLSDTFLKMVAIGP